MEKNTQTKKTQGDKVNIPQNDLYMQCNLKQNPNKFSCGN